jgi:GT2 family glycosyltransferase
MEWPKVYILVLNWNGWENTIECLESLMRLNYPNYGVVVIDNGSTNDSVEKIRSWAAGKVLAKATTADERITRLVDPPVAKPVSVVVIETKANLGYAGGNNIGLRYALSRKDCGYAWILNNDIIVHPEALTHLVRRMKEKPEAGICGSSLLRYYHPDKIDSIGGSKYDRWFAQAIGLETGKKFDPNQWEKYQKLERKMGYVAGAAVFVSRAFLLDVGLICEDYFMYFEEIDWATRARGRYSLAIAPQSIVYHKGGEDIKKHDGSKKRRFSLVYDKYTTKNRLLFTIKFYPYLLPILYLSILGYILDRIRVGAWENVWMISKGTLNHFYVDIFNPLTKWVRRVIKV